MGFFGSSRAANSAVLGRIWPKFELIRDIVVVFFTCKYEENLIKDEGARVLTRSYIDFSDAQGAGYSAVLSRIKLKFKLI